MHGEINCLFDLVALNVAEKKGCQCDMVKPAVDFLHKSSESFCCILLV